MIFKWNPLELVLDSAAFIPLPKYTLQTTDFVLHWALNEKGSYNRQLLNLHRTQNAEMANLLICPTHTKLIDGLIYKASLNAMLESILWTKGFLS